MKRFLSITLTFCIAAAVAFAGTLSASAAPTEAYTATLAAIAEYNQAHGGTGALVAAESGNEIIITGEATDVTTGIFLPHRVLWQAKLSGDTAGEALIRGSIHVMSGAEIFTTGRAIEGTDINVEDGIIFAAEAIYSPGGIVRITGGVVAGNIHASQLSIENARVDVDDVAGLENSIVYIAPTATTNLEDMLTNYIMSNGQGLLTVVGNVTLNSTIEFDVLYIPDSAKLTVAGAAFSLADDALLIVDGKLVLSGDYDFSGWKGTVAGKNADDLEGYWSRELPEDELPEDELPEDETPEDEQPEDELPEDETPEDESPEDEQPPKWWQRLPNWVQWILRYVCFGWIWMES